MAVAIAAASLGVLVGAPSSAGAHSEDAPAVPPPDAPVAAHQPSAPNPNPTTVAPTAAELTRPEPAVAGRGVYGPPEWLPLRRDLTGGEVIVGCTYDSHGSAHGYECAGHHDRWALDFIADTGTPVYAAGAGFATDLTGKPGGSGFGNVIRIDHGFGVATVYAHLSKVLIPPEGEWVDQDTLLGLVGMTGSASAPHLHFEEFAVPSAEQSGYYDQSSVDPGPLWGCRSNFLVAYPQVAGFDSWQGLPWGSLTVGSNGSSCADPSAWAPARSTASSSAAATTTGDAVDPVVRTRRWAAGLDDPAGA